MVSRIDGGGVDAPPAERVASPDRPLVHRLARVHRSLQARPKLWQEAVLLAVGFSLYSLIQKHVPLRAGEAVDRGRSLLQVEHRLHIDALHPLNDWLPRYHALTVVANYYYVAMHFLVPAGILIWLITRHVDRYRPERRVFVVMSLVGLATFWFAPTAPPRIVPGAGVVDTVSRFHTIGSYDDGATAHAADQFASMPSLHFAYALWVAVTMYRVARHHSVRLGWFVYPTLTAFDVLATGNHYVLDIPAGAAALALGYLISTAATRAARPLDRVPVRAP